MRTIVRWAAGLGFLALVVLPAFLAASAAFWGWLFMLIEGSLADHHILFQHPWGYGVCFLIGIPLTFILG